MSTKKKYGVEQMAACHAGRSSCLSVGQGIMPECAPFYSGCLSNGVSRQPQCNKATLPSTMTFGFLLTIIISILWAHDVSGQIIVVDAGHGYYSDCTNGDGRSSTEINTNHVVSLKLKYLIQNSCTWTVHLTRPDNGCGSWITLAQRTTMSNSWNGDRFLSIHCNAGGGTGTETFWCDQSPSASPSNSTDVAFSTEIQTQMVTQGQWTNRRVVEDDPYLGYHLYVLRNSNAPGCLSEIGFVDTPADAVKLLDEAWRDIFANAYYDAFQNHLNSPCGPPASLDCSNPAQLTCGVTYSGGASTAVSNVTYYGCQTWNGNMWDETGPERVHVVTTAQQGDLTATISNFTGDLDVWILNSCHPDSCGAFVSSSSATWFNAPAGTYYIVVDADDGSGSAYDLIVDGPGCSCPTPGQPDSITGLSVLCAGTTHSYSVPGVSGATGYDWSLPSGANILSGNNTNNITVNYSAGAVSGTISVKGINNCGDGPESAVLPVTIHSAAQVISLPSGWNMISTYIQPVEPGIEDVFSDIVADILIVKNHIGQSYLPSLHINTIGNWEITQGYKLKTSDSTSLVMICEQANPANTPVHLPAGWSMIAYLRTSPMDAVSAFGNISTNIIIVKDNQGESWVPSLGINSIGNLNPGQGYKIKMSDEDILYYPGN